MNLLLIVAGLSYTCYAEELSDFEDVFSFLTNGNKHSSNNNVHKSEKAGTGRSGVVHESYEMGFPPFPPIFLDPMPISNPVKSIPEEKEPLMDVSLQTSDNLNSKQKKKPKDKVIMSFTEFFVPFMNHKSSFDFPAFPKKIDFFDNIFKSFGFKDVDDPTIKATKVKQTPNKNVTKFEGTMIISNYPGNDTKKSERIKNLDSLLHKPPETEIVLYQNGVDHEKDTNPSGYGSRGSKRNTASGTNTDSVDRKKKSEFDEDDDYFAIRAAVKQEIPVNKKDQSYDNSLDKLMRMSLLYTVPILIGIGGAIIALEILRRDTRGKQNQMAKEYGPIQHC